MTSADKFDNHIGDWLSGMELPWNKLRYTLFQAHLRRHLPENQPLKILDAGGGNGQDAIPLALAGHEVTLVDYSKEMLAAARQAIDHHQVNITLHEADIFMIPHLFPEPIFDVVISHNVIQYVDDMPGAVKAICAPLKPGGIVSIININRYSDTLRAALLRQDLDEAFDQLGVRETVSPLFETPIKRYSGEEMIPALEMAGCELVGHYGVRCINDYIADNSLKSDPAFFARLEKLELALSDQYPYYLIARFFQLIGQKK